MSDTLQFIIVMGVFVFIAFIIMQISDHLAKRFTDWIDNRDT